MREDDLPLLERAVALDVVLALLDERPAALLAREARELVREGQVRVLNDHEAVRLVAEDVALDDLDRNLVDRRAHHLLDRHALVVDIVLELVLRRADIPHSILEQREKILLL